MEDENVEDFYEFRLFNEPPLNPSTAGNAQGPPRRIGIRSPSPDPGGPGFLIPRRSDTFYFASCGNAEKTEQFRRVAVSGEEILRARGDRWRGCELPWRVMTIKLAQQIKPEKSILYTDGDAGKRTRIGKKRRIALRKKIAMAEAKAVAAQMNQTEKETMEREKRTRRNREKKVKRKIKDKAKKASDS